MELTYKGTFPLLLQSGQRSAEKGACIDSWRTLFSAPCLAWSTPSFNWLENWITFVEESKGVKGISKDQWAHVLKFAKLSLKDESLSFHNDEQSWPALIDEFVDYVKAARGDKAPQGDVEMEY
jgi:DCN1-like protein 1/2